MCRVLNVARAGFYAWLHNPVSARDKDNQRLLMLFRDSYSLSGGVNGYRRVHGDLNEIGETCGKNRTARLSCTQTRAASTAATTGWLTFDEPENGIESQKISIYILLIPLIFFALSIPGAEYNQLLIMINKRPAPCPVPAGSPTTLNKQFTVQN